MINDIIWRAVKRAKVPAHKELTGLVLQNGKRLNDATLIPWSSGKALAWDVTIPDTYAMSRIQSTSVDSGSAAKHAARMKTLNYQDLNATHIFYPIAIETAGSWDDPAVELIEEIGRLSAHRSARSINQRDRSSISTTISTRNGRSEGNNVPLSEDLRSHSKTKRTGFRQYV